MGAAGLRGAGRRPLTVPLPLTPYLRQLVFVGLPGRQKLFFPHLPHFPAPLLPINQVCLSVRSLVLPMLGPNGAVKQFPQISEHSVAVDGGSGDLVTRPLSKLMVTVMTKNDKIMQFEDMPRSVEGEVVLRVGCGEGPRFTKCSFMQKGPGNVRGPLVTFLASLLP